MNTSSNKWTASAATWTVPQQWHRALTGIKFLSVTILPVALEAGRRVHHVGRAGAGMPGAGGGCAAPAAAAKVVARREQPAGQVNELMIHDKRRKKSDGRRPLTFLIEPRPTLGPWFIGRSRV